MRSFALCGRLYVKFWDYPPKQSSKPFTHFSASAEYLDSRFWFGIVKHASPHMRVKFGAFCNSGLL